VWFAIGGGTGLSMLLRGLKALPARRRQETDRHSDRRPRRPSSRLLMTAEARGVCGVNTASFPPGDIRNCMVALSQDEALLGRLFQYRFHSGRGLRGHSFGICFSPR